LTFLSLLAAAAVAVSVEAAVLAGIAPLLALLAAAHLLKAY
jgi:hypothetical protein